MQGLPIRSHRRRSRDHTWSLLAGIASIGMLLVLAILLVGCGDDDKEGTEPTIRHVEDFFPQEVGGMTREGSPQTATTAAELQDLIDGGYEIYTNHNFQEFGEQKYVGTVGGTQATLTAWIFEMATVSDAQNLHDDEQIQTGSCEDLDQLGDQERLCLGLGSQTIQFQRDRYWVKLSIDSNSQDARELLGLIGAHIDQEITG